MEVGATGDQYSPTLSDYSLARMNLDSAVREAELQLRVAEQDAERQQQLAAQRSAMAQLQNNAVVERAQLNQAYHSLQQQYSRNLTALGRHGLVAQDTLYTDAYAEMLPLISKKAFVERQMDRVGRKRVVHVHSPRKRYLSEQRSYYHSNMNLYQQCSFQNANVFHANDTTDATHYGWVSKTLLGK